MSLVSYIEHKDFIIVAEDTLISSRKNGGFVSSENYFTSKLFSANFFAIACYGNFGEKIPVDKNADNDKYKFEKFVNDNFRLTLISKFVSGNKNIGAFQAGIRLEAIINEYSRHAQLKLVHTQYLLCGIENNEFCAYKIYHDEEVKSEKVIKNYFINEPSKENGLNVDLKLTFMDLVMSLEDIDNPDVYVKKVREFYNQVIENENYPTVGGRFEYVLFNKLGIIKKG